ncbi:pilus assembly protein PilO [Lampropedia puyangensis]|uniref:Pilus assembly protein PilO n=1 Tax=Lampropedia puyangensis TaxID=1330072 RepID=A0A4S8F5V7_9BURK|nr:type 4a pilus biogenesis protein PilO [Lampropedia puyangensis]THU00682.1 pilus assembly protein PilO [Lampropedia puyangensis]
MNKWLSQFQQTSGRDPWVWPIVPRLFLFFFVAIFVAVLLWFLWLSGFRDELDASRATELSLRQDFSRDYKKAINLDALKKQKEQVIEYVNLLEKQLPNQAEMAALLSDINQAGIGRGLQFDVFKPGAPQVKEYYAEQPIEISVTGSYDAIAQFASDVAHLSRIVTIGDLDLSKSSQGNLLSMRAGIKTYRYLSLEEQQRTKNSK